MFNLVIKDFLIQKKTFLYSILYALFAIAAFSNTFTQRGAYMFGAMSVTYLFVSYSNSYDEKNRCEVMLNSLPVLRKELVTAKYVSLCLFALTGVVMAALSGLIIEYSGFIRTVRIINFQDIAAIVIALGLMYSIYYPLYFKYGLLKIRIFNIFLYLFFLFAPNFLITLIKNNPDNMFIKKSLSFISSQPDWLLQAGVLTFTFLIIAISFNISVRVYKRKDF